MSTATHAVASSHEHHEAPTSGRALTRMALSATLHCLTGCAIGEVAGMLIGTALAFSNLGTVVLSVALAFVFGYGLTSLPLLRAELALAVVVPIALASDTLSIATMEVVDNGIVVAVPGAMDAGLGQLLFWGSLAFSLPVAGAFALPVNRWLLARGKEPRRRPPDRHPRRALPAHRGARRRRGVRVRSGGADRRGRGLGRQHRPRPGPHRVVS